MWSVKCEVWSVKEAVRSVKCEVWVKCGVWSAKWEVWSLECEVWSGKEAVRSEKCEVWTGKCGVWIVECEVRSEKCEVRSVKEAVRSEKCGVWSAQWEVWSVKCEVWSVKDSSEKWEVWNVEWEVWNGSEKCGLWNVKCEVWTVKYEVWSVDCEVWSVKCGLWSVKCEVWTVKCEVCSVKCEVWGLDCEGSSEKWEVWSVKCGVWSLKFGVRRVQCAVWGVECRGKDTVGTGCLWTIGHLCLGNFRRRLARVYVIKTNGNPIYWKRLWTINGYYKASWDDETSNLWKNQINVNQTTSQIGFEAHLGWQLPAEQPILLAVLAQGLNINWMCLGREKLLEHLEQSPRQMQKHHVSNLYKFIIYHHVSVGFWEANALHNSWLFHLFSKIQSFEQLEIADWVKIFLEMVCFSIANCNTWPKAIEMSWGYLQVGLLLNTRNDEYALLGGIDPSNKRKWSVVELTCSNHIHLDTYVNVVHSYLKFS